MKNRCSNCSREPLLFLILPSLRILTYFMVRRNNGDFDFFFLFLLVPVPSSSLWHFSSQQKPFQSLPELGTLQLAEARVLARIQFLSFKVTVVSSLEGIGKGRQFHALLTAKISLYFESVKIRSFSKFLIYKTLCKS